MTEHILIKFAKRKPYKSIPQMPQNAYFDSIKGYWILNDLCLISQSSDFGKLTSKKCDQETGEDMKGE